MGALEQLETFLLKYPIYDQYSEQVHQELDICLFIRKQLNNPASDIHVEKLNGSINKEGANYAACWMNNTTMVFTSTRSDAKTHSNALYKAALQNNGFSEAEKMRLPVLQNKQTGAASFTTDGNRMYFTGWLVNEAGKKQSAIYCSERKGDNWSEPVLIDNADYNARQPQVTADGKYLLFASDRPGGVGGYDIWYAELDNNGRVGAITNMGPAINTAADEEAPFYHATSNTLVFASKGRIGMGGFDLFASTGSFSTSWSAGVNMGYPVNSVKDDTYFISRGAGLLEDAIISSDRSSACCLELFSVHKNQINTVAGR
jgi:OOP family OmpA-OmpF porin